jgi:hypothetical protein
MDRVDSLGPVRPGVGYRRVLAIWRREMGTT